MNLSIRLKLFLYMTVSIVIFAILLYGVNSFFIEGYYINSKKQSLTEVSREIAKIIEHKDIADFKSDDLIYVLDRLEKSTGAAIIIGKIDGSIYYPNRSPFLEYTKRIEHNPFFEIESQPPEKPKPDAPPNAIKTWDKQADGSVFITTQDPRFMIETLRYQFETDNGLMVSVWIPMAEITASASVSNRFTFFVALITMLITGIWALFISGRFTRPIKQMNRITKEMSELNFSQALDISGADEIGQLSQSINHLSERLALAISELDTRNKELEGDIDRERKLDKLRREFISSVSHELKTPIFLIQGYAEGLKNNIAQDKEKKDFYCDVIIDEANKMDILVKDLLDLSQMESGMFAVKRVDFDLAFLVRELVQKFERTFCEKGLNLELRGPDSLRVNADPVRIEQIIVNFINNAFNHLNTKKILRIEIADEGKKAKITVFNSGHPVPEESLDKIWESFYKVDKARTRKNSGIGMGLSIVKAIQEAHRNEYGVKNIKGGVEFWAYIDKAN